MKHRAVVIYLLIVVIGAAAVAALRRSPAEAVATRHLAANELLETGDLLLSLDGRQYLAREVDANERVGIGEIRTLDGLTSVPEGIPVAVPVPEAAMLEAQLRAGDAARLCPGDVRAVVRASFCGAAGSSCIVVAAVAPSEADVTVQSSDLTLSTGDGCE